LCAKEAAPHLKANGWGRIVNIGGMAGRTGGALSAGARNVAVVNLTKGLALELGPHGVNVNAVHPGRTLTENVRAELEAQSQKHGKVIDVSGGLGRTVFY